MKRIWNIYKEKILTFFLCGLLCVGVVSIIALLGGAIMKIFGFEYKSIASIILFFVIATIISYPCSLIADALPKVFLYFGKLSKQMAILLYIVLDTFATFYGLRVVDYFMQSVSATDISIFIVSLILALFGISDIDKKENIDRIFKREG
ncbi:MAG: regulatory YrvL family protein [Clostridium celatum]|nr:regulatory YrvL family protein [Clostridium celatum]